MSLDKICFIATLIYTVLIRGSECAPTPINITVSVGSTAVLPCDWSHVSTALSSNQSGVQWRNSSGVVFERHQQKLFQGEGYEGRVDVPEDQLLKGDCSLVLNNVRPEDAGEYKSYLLLPNKHVSILWVKLSVVEKSKENNSETSDSSDGRCSNCRNNLSPGERGGVIVGVIVGVTVGVISVVAVVLIVLRKKGIFDWRRDGGSDPIRNDPEGVTPVPTAKGDGNSVIYRVGSGVSKGVSNGVCNPTVNGPEGVQLLPPGEGDGDVKGAGGDTDEGSDS